MEISQQEKEQLQTILDRAKQLGEEFEEALREIEAIVGTCDDIGEMVMECGDVDSLIAQIEEDREQ